MRTQQGSYSPIFISARTTSRAGFSRCVGFLLPVNTALPPYKNPLYQAASELVDYVVLSAREGETDTDRSADSEELAKY